MLNSHLEDANSGAEVYEAMSVASEDIMMKYSGCSEDIYESMVEINPECADSLCKIRFYLLVLAIINEPISNLEVANADGAALLFYLIYFFSIRRNDDCSRRESRGSDAQEVLPRYTVIWLSCRLC